MLEVWRPDSGKPVPWIVEMHVWEPCCVRIVEAYDITWDAIIRRFDYLGPDGRQHHISQVASFSREALLKSAGVKKRARIKKIFKPDSLTQDEMIDILHEHWRENYA